MISSVPSCFSANKALMFASRLRRGRSATRHSTYKSSRISALLITTLRGVSPKMLTSRLVENRVGILLLTPPTHDYPNNNRVIHNLKGVIAKLDFLLLWCGEH